jgi:hypothetical protein
MLRPFSKRLCEFSAVILQTGESFCHQDQGIVLLCKIRREAMACNAFIGSLGRSYGAFSRSQWGSWVRDWGVEEEQRRCSTKICTGTYLYLLLEQ